MVLAYKSPMKNRSIDWNAVADVCNVDGVSREDAKTRRKGRKKDP
jgi:hypothetical protein